MPDAQTQFDEALQRLQLYVQPTVPPVISTSDLQAILRSTAYGTIWTAETVYYYGDVILPTVRNGHSYVVTVAGTSAATEPDWPLYASSILSEGESDPLLTWQENGPDFSNLYNVRKAIAQAAGVKKTMAAALYANGNAQMQQVFDHWEKVEQAHASLEIA